MTLEQQFTQLAAEWRRETMYWSSTWAIAMHPSYQRIIGMGPAAVPLIIRELERQPEHWFWALKAITGADPVLPADRGNIAKMQDAWLQWALEQKALNDVAC